MWALGIKTWMIELMVSAFTHRVFSLPLILSLRDSHWTWSSLTQLGWPVEPRHPFISASKSLGLCVYTAMHGLARHGPCWGSKHRSSCLHSKHFADWATASAPTCTISLEWQKRLEADLRPYRFTAQYLGQENWTAICVNVLSGKCCPVKKKKKSQVWHYWKALNLVQNWGLPLPAGLFLLWLCLGILKHTHSHHL